MDLKLSHSELNALFAERSGLSDTDAEMFTNAVFELISDGLDSDGIVKINGLGTFKITDVDSRFGIDVNTGERIEIKEHKKITFVPADSLKETINAPFAMFRPVEVDDDYVDDDENIVDKDEKISETGDDENISFSSNVEKSLECNDEPDIENESVSDEAESLSNENPACEIGEDGGTETNCEVDADGENSSVASASESPLTVEEQCEISENHNEPKDKKELHSGDNTSSITSDTVGRKAAHNKIIWKVVIFLIAVVGLVCGMFWREYDKIFFRYVTNDAEDVKMTRSETKEYIQNVVTKGNEIIENADTTFLPDDTVTIVKNDTLAVLSVDVDVKKTVVEKKNETTVESKEEKNAVKKQPEKKFRIVDNVKSRDLAVVTSGDTLDYEITGVICSHIVLSEETLTKISLKYYGDKRLWPYIVKYNKMKNPNDLACDMVLKIPRLQPKQ